MKITILLGLFYMYFNGSIIWLCAPLYRHNIEVSPACNNIVMLIKYNCPTHFHKSLVLVCNIHITIWKLKPKPASCKNEIGHYFISMTKCKSVYTNLSHKQQQKVNETYTWDDDNEILLFFTKGINTETVTKKFSVKWILFSILDFLASIPGFYTNEQIPNLLKEILSSLGWQGGSFGNIFPHSTQCTALKKKSAYGLILTGNLPITFTTLSNWATEAHWQRNRRFELKFLSCFTTIYWIWFLWLTAQGATIYLLHAFLKLVYLPTKYYWVATAQWEKCLVTFKLFCTYSCLKCSPTHISFINMSTMYILHIL